MLEVNKQVLSARVNADEQAFLTDYLKDYQNVYGVTFGSFKEFLFFLANQPIVNTGKEIIEVEKIKDDLIEYSEKNELPVESTAIQIINHALKTEPKTIEVEKEITVEVEKPVEVEKIVEKTIEVEKALSEDQLLLELTPKQLEIIKQTNANRNELLKKRGIDKQETLVDTFLTAFFNQGTLYNWSGEFFTGLK